MEDRASDDNGSGGDSGGGGDAGGGSADGGGGGHEGDAPRQPGSPDDRASPETPAPRSGDSVGSKWSLIDKVEVSVCAINVCPLVDCVPTELEPLWAAAYGEVLHRIAEAPDDIELQRALKVKWALPGMLLRKGVRGGRRRRGNQLKARLTRFCDGDWDAVIGWWLSERALLRRTKQSQRLRTTAETIEDCERFMAKGEMSKAVASLGSLGLADPCAREVCEQLRRKHPRRKCEVPGVLSHFGEFGDVDIDVREVLRTLKPRTGVGINGMRNEYMTSLTRGFKCPRAVAALSAFGAFARLYASAKLPDWFYFWDTAVKLVPLVKSFPDDGSVPDVRPLGLGNGERRVVARALMQANSETLREILAPEQIAVGVSGGLSVLVFGIRLHLEWYPEHVAIKVDFKNGFNEGLRSAALEEIDRHPKLRENLLPFAWTTTAPKSPIYLGSGHNKADFNSEEGWQQGDPIGPSMFCLAVNKELKATTALLAPHGGFVMADMDDTYIVGPPRAAFDAFDSLRQRIKDSCGLEVQPTKSAAYSTRGPPTSSSPDAWPANFPIGGITDATDPNVTHPGILVAGVPIGSRGYINAVMCEHGDRIVSKIKSTVDMLRPKSAQALHTALYYSLQPLGDYWLQHVYPSDVLASGFASRIDDAIREGTDAAWGAKVSADAFARERSTLPSRMKGGGIRSRSVITPAAFVGAAVKAIPQFIDCYSGLAGTAAGPRRGYFHHLAVAIGAGAFEEGGHRYATLMAPRHEGGHLGLQLKSAWRSLQQQLLQLEGLTQFPPDDERHLAKPAEHLITALKPQRELMKERELATFASMNRWINTLPPEDMRRSCWIEMGIQLTPKSSQD